MHARSLSNAPSTESPIHVGGVVEFECSAIINGVEKRILHQRKQPATTSEAEEDAEILAGGAFFPGAILWNVGGIGRFGDFLTNWRDLSNMEGTQQRQSTLRKFAC